MSKSQKFRILSIFCAAELAIVGISTAFGYSGFNSGQAFASAFWGMHWAVVFAVLVVLDHEARGKGK